MVDSRISSRFCGAFMENFSLLDYGAHDTEGPEELF